ncbi:MAG: hypothetical protein OER92_02640 [Alphaproteobacteria bacterium]|nr:hypothetical protein [Alphaproteobacteria bacterium]
MGLEFFIHVSAVGILATYVHLIFALWAPRYGLPRLDFPRAMTQLTFGDSFEGPAPYGWGIAVIHMNGIMFALLYATVIAPYMPGDLALVVRGLIWGGILFIAAQLIFVPFFLKDGFFGMKGHAKGWITALFVHLLYGLILGWLSPIA